RIQLEPIESGLQITRQLAQLAEERELATLHERIELFDKASIVAGRERAGERCHTGTVFLAQGGDCSRHCSLSLDYLNAGLPAGSVRTRTRSPALCYAAFAFCSRILSIFSLSVTAVNGLMT